MDSSIYCIIKLYYVSISRPISFFTDHRPSTCLSDSILLLEVKALVTNQKSGISSQKLFFNDSQFLSQVCIWRGVGSDMPLKHLDLLGGCQMLFPVHTPESIHCIYRFNWAFKTCSIHKRSDLEKQPSQTGVRTTTIFVTQAFDKYDELTGSSYQRFLSKAFRYSIVCDRRSAVLAVGKSKKHLAYSEEAKWNDLERIFRVNKCRAFR